MEESVLLRFVNYLTHLIFQSVMRVLVGVLHNGAITTPCVQSLLTLDLSDFEQRIIQFEKGTIVHFQRNNVVKKALDAGVDYLFFVDSDVAVPSNAVKKLVAHGKHIVSGLYFSKIPPFTPQIYSKNKLGFKPIIDYEEGLIKVDAVGSGCLLVKTSVFKNLKKPFFAFSDKIVRGGQPLSEDMYFCNKAREAGFDVYCDTTVKCAHVGTTLITEEAFKRLKNKIVFQNNA